MDNLKPQKDLAAFLLARGMLGKDVAKEVGVTPETISHWKHDKHFLALMNEYKLEIVESLREKLRLIAGKALATLDHLMDNGSDPVKVNACSAVLKHAGFKSPELLVWGIGQTEVEETEKVKK